MTEHYLSRFIRGKVVNNIDSFFLLIKSINYILLKIIFKFQHLTLQHDDSYFIACRNTMGFRCILRLVAEMKMPKYPRIAIFEGTSYQVKVIFMSKQVDDYIWTKIKENYHITIQNFRRVIQKRYLATLGYFQIHQTNQATSNTIQLDRYNFYQTQASGYRLTSNNV